MDMKSCSCATRFWRRRKKKNPKTAKTMRARPPITPPTIGPTGVELFPEVEVLGTEVADVASEDTDEVVSDSVPFWITRSVNVRGVELFP